MARSLRILRRSVRQDAGDGVREPLPAARLFDQLLAAGLGQLVELRLAVVVGVAPLRGDQPLLLEPVQRRVERALVDLQDVARDLLDAAARCPSRAWGRR